MEKTNRAEYAAQLRSFHGCNCCQAVAVALADETNLPAEQLKQIASGFGGGMGTMDGTCGALVGTGKAKRHSGIQGRSSPSSRKCQEPWYVKNLRGSVPE